MSTGKTVADCANLASAFPKAGISKTSCCTDKVDGIFWSCNDKNRITMIIAQAPQNQELPDSLSLLSELDSLTLNNASLSGSIPYSLGQLTKLDYLDLGNNFLTGNIPDSLGDLVALEYLYLQDNALTGRVPKSFNNLEKLKHLNVKQNCLLNNPFLEVSLPFTSIEDDYVDGPKCKPGTTSLATPTSTPTPTPSPAQKSSSSPRLSTKATAGIRVASGLLIIGALVGLFGAAISSDSTHGPKCNPPTTPVATPTATPTQKSASSPKLSTKAITASGLLVIGALVGLFV
ncbi:hypothetical protein HDU76_009831 [Blyttiomyces sp. JEL0837]|nr:hypothetical protein HDU76_009831 [Blyttiomyces sp. JEL0837]